MLKKTLTGLALFALVLMPGILPGTLQAGAEVVGERVPFELLDETIRTYCFPSQGSCETSQSSATCEKSGCYPANDDWCYECNFAPAITVSSLEEFLTWLAEGTEVE